MQKAEITPETFYSLDVRMCRIEKAELVLKKPKKEAGVDNPIVGYKLTINTGFDTRECFTNIVSYQPEGLVGSVAAFVLNLPPREIRGIMSSAMIMAAGHPMSPGILATKAAELGAVVI